MGLWKHARETVLRGLEVPGMRHLGAAIYERQFSRNTRRRVFRGIYDSFDAALASVPIGTATGWDNLASANLCHHLVDRIFPSDYPEMFWLAKLFAARCDRVFDVGGHIGVAYYAYDRYVDYPPSLDWLVHDLPAVMAEGREWAKEHDHHGRLRFATQFADGSGCDILLASGSLQYIRPSLADMLVKLKRPPHHLIVNQMPLTASRTYYTLSGSGASFSVYRIESEADFLGGLARQGYRVVDRWENPEKNCVIPFAHQYWVDGYTGFYLHLGD